MIGRVLAMLALLAPPPNEAHRGVPLTGGPVTEAIAAAGFTGHVLIARGDTILVDTDLPCAIGKDARPVYGAARTGMACDHLAFPGDAHWPWASVTKQVVAVLTMIEVDRGRITLDDPASRYLPALATGPASPTIRQLIQHRAGLRNPDDTPAGPGGWPSWYAGGPTGLRWCLEGRGPAGGAWRYNNCDTIVLGAVLEAATGQRVETLFADRIARPLGLDATGFVRSGDKAIGGPLAITPTEHAVLARFGAAGGLIGSPRDLLKIDRALLTGRLLSEKARAEMWKGDPGLGYMALAQWSFDAPLKGCATPVRLIERRGGIGRFQVRNILIPARDMSIVLFTAVPEDRFDFGEIWQGKGFAYDLLSAAACPA